VVRVLQVTEAAMSGTFEVTRQLCEHLAAEGHEVMFAYGQRPETPDPVSALAPGVGFVALPWARRSARAHVAAGAALRRIVAQWQPDVVHLHSAFAGFVGAVALGGSGLPLAYTPHGSPVGRTIDGRARLAAYRRLEALVARRVAVVGAVSHAEASLLSAVAATEAIVVVPNGIAELDDGATRTTPDRRSGVIAMGRVVPERRPAATAAILRELAGTAPVAWVGDGPPAGLAAVRAAGVPVTGWLPRQEALDRLRHAAVLLHWSASDGAPVVVLEAMAHDVVVVASDIAANRELLGDEQTRGTADEAVALVRRVLAEPRLRDELLAHQRARRAAYGAAAMAASWIEHYTRIVAGTETGRSRVASTPAGASTWT
jgi:glycosyltransferase involved in cell wall biosynthesis